MYLFEAVRQRQAYNAGANDEDRLVHDVRISGGLIKTLLCFNSAGSRGKDTREGKDEPRGAGCSSRRTRLCRVSV